MSTAPPTLATPPPAQPIIDDASSPTYRVTSLHPSEVDEWLDHLTASFAHKGTPRAYFQRHLTLDPALDWAGILVLRLPSPPTPPRCVSSIRVFLRPIYIDGQPTMLGGIGEVSTQPAHRGRGYAEACLTAGLAYLASLGIHLSSLHTSNVPHYYHRLGWRRVERVHAVLPLPPSLTAAAPSIPQPSLTPTPTSTSLTPCIAPLTPSDLSPPSPTLTALSSIYASYAPHFNGPVHRSSEYWQSWVRGELAHSLTTPTPILGFTYHHPPSAPTPTAYILASRITWEMHLTLTPQPTPSLTPNPTPTPTLLVKQHLAVREFACSDDLRRADGGRAAFLALVVRAAEAAGFGEGEGEGGGDALMVRVALPIVSLFQPPLAVPYTREDAGFMYRPIDAAAELPVTDASHAAQPGRYSRKDFEGFASSSGEELMQRLHHEARLKHVFFDTDAF